MEKHYLIGLEITEDNTPNGCSRVIVTGRDYKNKEFGGVFPKSIIKDGKLEVQSLGDCEIGEGLFPRVIPANGCSFEGRREVLVRLEDVERVVN